MAWRPAARSAARRADQHRPAARRTRYRAGRHPRPAGPQRRAALAGGRARGPGRIEPGRRDHDVRRPPRRAASAATRVDRSRPSAPPPLHRDASRSRRPAQLRDRRQRIHRLGADRPLHLAGKCSRARSSDGGRGRPARELPWSSRGCCAVAASISSPAATVPTGSPAGPSCPRRPARVRRRRPAAARSPSPPAKKRVRIKIKVTKKSRRALVRRMRRKGKVSVRTYLAVSATGAKSRTLSRRVTIRRRPAARRPR
jgi:hypothetical protein